MNVEQQKADARESAANSYNHGPSGCDCDLCLGITAGVDKAFAITVNYTANDDTFPTEATFANGRRVGIAFDGDKPYLTVGKIR